MLETVIVIVVLVAALAAGTFAWTYRRFSATRARLIAYLRRAAPEMAVGGLTNVGFSVQVLGTEIDVDLATLARRRPPAISERAWFDQVIDGIRARVPTAAAAPYPLVADRILPLLKPTVYAAIFDRYPPALRLAWRPLTPDVAVTYVVAGRDQRTVVTSGMIEAWAIGVEALHDRSVENLRKQTMHLLAELGGPRVRYEHIDGYDATRILVADLIVPAQIADPLIAIPDETVLLVAPSSDRAALAAETAARHATSARPLSPVVLQPSACGPTVR